MLIKYLHLWTFAITAICCASVAAAPAGRDALFARYAATPVYHGPIQLPRFKDRDHAFVGYRTRIRDGMRQGANFAGHYALIGWGCGTSCLSYVAGDVVTGQMFNFPLSGEDFIDLEIEVRPDSRLIFAHWAADANPGAAGASVYNCVRQQLLWNGRTAMPLAKPAIFATVKFEDVDKCDN
ncbi:MAG TPA: hypothetical protein VJS85_08645 [Rhizomicrobium sp.]|nr:hypothetical protein [Rhizomicrobium sp.]